MTKEETARLLAVMQTAYPNYKPQDKTMAIDLWYAMLCTYDFQTVIIALQTYIATDTSGFAPAIGQLIDKLNSFTASTELTEMEAWAMVSKAIRNGGYHSQEEFDKLPEDVQRAVGSANMIHTWALDECYNESVVMSQFIRSYKTAVNQRQEREKLPENVRNLIENTMGRLEG